VCRPPQLLSNACERRAEVTKKDAIAWAPLLLGQEGVGSLFRVATYDRQTPMAEKDSRPPSPYANP
jgi:hypothetical protein